MQSSRCIELGRGELNKLGLSNSTVELGKVEIKGNVSSEYLKMLDNALKESGLEVVVNKEIDLIKKIKEAIDAFIGLPDEAAIPNFSEFISQKTKHDYVTLSKVFINTLGITIEKFIIKQKIERVKELLVYDKLSINDIAYKLHYSSVAHLSNQFKKVTGLTPAQFKQLRDSSLPKSENV